MKLFVNLIIACVLFKKVYSLRCTECMGEQCSPTEVTCLSPQKCGSALTVIYMGKLKASELSVRSCLQPKHCMSGSMNLGIIRTESSTRCCTTDLCNNGPVPEIEERPFNGKQCFTCVGNDCTSTVKCQGDENSCVKMTVTAGGQTTTTKGCISSSFCAAADDVTQMLANVGKPTLDCCEGNLCNEAHTYAGLGLMPLLLLSLACFSLFY